MKFVLSAGLALASWVALADTTAITNDFNTIQQGTWTATSGTAAITTTGAKTGSVIVGSALTVTNSTTSVDEKRQKTIGSNEAVYDVSGVGTCKTGFSARSDYASTDFVMYVDEAGDEPDYEDALLTGSQIAVAAGPGSGEGSATNSTVYVYCKTNGTDFGWIPTTTTVATGAWYRVTLDFDYTQSKCQVCLNGVAANSSYGTTASTNATTGGSWYTIATVPSTTTITNLSFVGVTQVDDVVIANTTELATYDYNAAISTETTGSGAWDIETAISVPYSYLAKYSIPATKTAVDTLAGDGTSLTVGEKYAAGLEPNDGIEFEAKAMTVTSTGGTITVPCKFSHGQGYWVVFTDASGNIIDHNDHQSDWKLNNDNTVTLNFTWPTDESVTTYKGETSTVPKVIKFQVDVQ